VTPLSSADSRRIHSPPLPPLPLPLLLLLLLQPLPVDRRHSVVSYKRASALDRTRDGGLVAQW